jgi:hypothetical protein
VHSLPIGEMNYIISGYLGMLHYLSSRRRSLVILSIFEEVIRIA